MDTTIYSDYVKHVLFYICGNAGHWFIEASVSDHGCSSRIPNPNFSISVPGSRVKKKAPDPGSGSATTGKNLSIFNPKIPSRIPWLKKHRIPDPQHCSWCGRESLVLLPGANDARLALAEDEVLEVDVRGDLVAGGDQAQLPDDHARLQAKYEFQISFLSQIFCLGGIFWFFSYYIQHCFICRPSESTVPTDAAIEPRTVASCNWCIDSKTL